MDAIQLDFATGNVIGPTGSVWLSEQQFDVIAHIVSGGGEPISSTDIITNIWPDPDFEPDWAEVQVRVILSIARRKLASVGYPDTIIKTVWRAGYRLSVPVLENA